MVCVVGIGCDIQPSTSTLTHNLKNFVNAKFIFPKLKFHETNCILVWNFRWSLTEPTILAGHKSLWKNGTPIKFSIIGYSLFDKLPFIPKNFLCYVDRRLRPDEHFKCVFNPDLSQSFYLRKQMLCQLVVLWRLFTLLVMYPSRAACLSWMDLNHIQLIMVRRINLYLVHFVIFSLNWLVDWLNLWFIYWVGDWLTKDRLTDGLNN